MPTRFSHHSSWFHAAFLTIAVCIFCALPAPVAAYCPLPDIRVNGEFFKASIVFTGKVVSARNVPDKGEQEGGWFYRLRVMDTFRGPSLHEITVFTGDDSNRFPLVFGQEYLLFAYRGDGRLVIDCCGNSAPLSEAGDSLQILRALLDHKLPTEVEGYLFAENKAADLSHVTVTIHGTFQTYTVTTDKEGRFRFQAPPGKYQVDFAARKYFVTDTDKFWYNPHGFVLHSGECASLELFYATESVPPIPVTHRE